MNHNGKGLHCLVIQRAAIRGRHDKAHCKEAGADRLISLDVVKIQTQNLIGTAWG